ETATTELRTTEQAASGRLQEASGVDGRCAGGSGRRRGIGGQNAVGVHQAVARCKRDQTGGLPRDRAPRCSDEVTGHAMLGFERYLRVGLRGLDLMLAFVVLN